MGMGGVGGGARREIGAANLTRTNIQGSLL